MSITNEEQVVGIQSSSPLPQMELSKKLNDLTEEGTRPIIPRPTSLPQVVTLSFPPFSLSLARVFTPVFRKTQHFRLNIEQSSISTIIR